MRLVDLIIFDLDGTLVDSRKDIVEAVNFTLKKTALQEKCPEEIISYVGTGVEDLLKKSLGEKNNRLLKKAVSIFEKYYKKHFLNNTVLYPNVKEALGHFKDKRKAIVTNRKYEFALDILKALGIFGYFESVIGGDNLGCMKPSSCPLNNMMKFYNIEDKDRAIMVGDMDIDILAAKAAGIASCAVTYGIGKRQDIIKTSPDYMIDDISELKGIID